MEAKIKEAIYHLDCIAQRVGYSQETELRLARQLLCDVLKESDSLAKGNQDVVKDPPIWADWELN